MSQLEPMMAEENKKCRFFDGRDGDEAFLVALPHPWLVSQVQVRQPPEGTGHGLRLRGLAGGGSTAATPLRHAPSSVSGRRGRAADCVNLGMVDVAVVAGPPLSRRRTGRSHPSSRHLDIEAVGLDAVQPPPNANAHKDIAAAVASAAVVVVICGHPLPPFPLLLSRR